MSQLWSAEQHQWLAALGHTLYVPGSAEAPAVPQVEQVTKAIPGPVAAPRPSRRHAQADASPGAPHGQQAPARRGSSRLPDKLHFALIRASGCNPNSADAAAIIASWPPSSELRGNPAAKRALWPQLRALRRRQPQ